MNIKEIATRLVCAELNSSQTWIYEMSESRRSKIAKASVLMAQEIREETEKIDPSKIEEILEVISETDTFVAETCPEAYLVERLDKMKDIVKEMK